LQIKSNQDQEKLVILSLLIVDYEYDSQISALQLEVDEFEEMDTDMPLVYKTYLD
jgi:hypothetical protein